MFTNMRSPRDRAKLKGMFEGQLDLRAPEDAVASDEQVRNRFDKPTEEFGIEDALDGLLRAWIRGDRDDAAAIADEVQRQTRGHFEAKGVPVFAHPVLPPQFTRRAVEAVQMLPTRAQGTALDELVSHFKPDLRAGVVQELERAASAMRPGRVEPSFQSSSAMTAASPLRLGGESLSERADALFGSMQRRGAGRQIVERHGVEQDDLAQDGRDREPTKQVSLLLPASANVTAQGQLTDVRIETPGADGWGPTNRKAANVVMTRIRVVGDAIQKFVTDEEKKAWSDIKRIVLDDQPLRTGGAAENNNDALLIDLSRVAPGGNPTKDVNEAYALFLLVHEIRHSTSSDRKAYAAARKMPRARGKREGEIGTPEWSVEVRNDKLAYDLLVRAGLIDPRITPIERVAPYYAEHLRHPEYPVIAFPGVPGYDQPLP